MSEMQMQQGFGEVIDRLKAEGQLTRNSGANSLKSVRDTLASELAGIGEGIGNMSSGIAEMATATQTPAPQSAADQEEEQDNEARQNKLLSMIGNLGKGIGDLAKGGADKAGEGFGKAMKSIMGIVKKFKMLFIVGGLLLLLPILEKFFNSPIWTQMKKTFNDKILPALIKLKDFFMTTMVPFFEDVLGILFNFLGKGFEAIGTLVDDIFGENADTSFIGIVKSIGKYIGTMLDATLTAVFNIIARIFGMEGTDSVFGSIGNFFSSIYDSVAGFFTVTIPAAIAEATSFLTQIKDKVVGFFTDMYNSVVNFFTVTIPAAIANALSFLTQMKDKVVGIFTDLWNQVRDLFGDFSVFKFVEDTFGQLFTTIKNIFGGDFSLANLVEGGKALFDIVFYGINLAINAVKDIFGFGDPEKPFKLSEFLFGPEGIVTSVVNFFKKIFSPDFDIMANVEKAIANIFGLFTEMFNKIINFDFMGWITENIPGVGKVIEVVGGIGGAIGRMFESDAERDERLLKEGAEAAVKAAQVSGKVDAEAVDKGLSDMSMVTTKASLRMGKEITETLLPGMQKFADMSAEEFQKATLKDSGEKISLEEAEKRQADLRTKLASEEMKKLDPAEIKKEMIKGAEAIEDPKQKKMYLASIERADYEANRSTVEFMTDRLSEAAGEIASLFGFGSKEPAPAGPTVVNAPVNNVNNATNTTSSSTVLVPQNNTLQAMRQGADF